MKVVSSDDIAQAVDACVEATQATGIDEARLAAKGWKSGQIQKDGKAIGTPLSFYGHADNRAIILGAKDGSPARLCAVIARIPALSAYSGVAQALTTHFGTAPIKQKDNEFYWRRNGRIVALTPSGTPKEPGVRVGIMITAQETK